MLWKQWYFFIRFPLLEHIKRTGKEGEEACNYKRCEFVSA